MMGSVSAKERVARQRAQAVANNEVIVIDDSDDEEEEDSKPKALPTVKAPVANTKVKSEPTVAAKRTNEEINDTESSSASDKRTKVTEMAAVSQAARRVSSNPSPDLDMAPAVSNEEETTSNSNLVSQRREVTSNKDVYLVDTGGKLHSLEAEEKEKEIEEEARVEYTKACNMEHYQYNGNDNKWVMKWLELKQFKATTGVWPTTSTLGNFCKYQRDLRKKNVKGQKTTLTAGRIKMLDNIGFPWGSDITPMKQSATSESNNSNVVSPQEVEDASRFIEELVGNKTTSPLKESTPSQDGRITISVVKTTRDTKLGLSVAKVSLDDTQSSSLLKVTCVSPGSLFDGSNLKEGMIVDAVNGVSYATYKEVLAALQNAEGQMTITTKEEVSPAAQPLKVPTPDDGLKELLSICELEQYLGKFKEAGISSADELKSKLKDVSFMEKLVDDINMKASEAIRLQVRVSSM